MRKKVSSQIGMSYIFPFFMLLFFVFLKFHRVVLPSNCEKSTFASNGDGLNTAWNNMIMTKQSFPPWQSSTSWVNFPMGEPFWTSDWWSSIIPRSFLFLFSKVTNPICGYNLTAFTGVFLTSLFAYILIFRLIKNVLVGLISGIVMSFSSYLTYAIPQHVHKTFMWGLLLVILLCFESLKKASIQRLVVLGLVSGIAAYIDGYYTVMILISVFAFTIVFLNGLRRNYFSPNRFNFTSAFIPLFLFFILQIPNVVALAIDSPHTFYGLRSIQALEIFRLQIWHLLVPSPNNPYLPQSIKHHLQDRLDGSNFTETSFYLTWTFIVFAILALTKKSRIRINFEGISLLPKSKAKSKELDAVLLFLFAVMSIAFMISFFPSFWRPIFEYIPFFRTLARFGLLLDISIICLGAIGMQIVLKRFASLQKRLSVMLLILAMLSLELGIPNSQIIPVRNFSVESPSAYVWIRENTPKEAIILEFLRWTPGASHLGFGVIHERKVANPWRPHSILMTERFYDAGSIGFVCYIKSHHVNFVIEHQHFPISTEFLDLGFLNLVYPQESSVDYSQIADIRIFQVDSGQIPTIYDCDNG